MFNWSNELETGNEVVDTQHRKIIEVVNNLIIACDEGVVSNEIDLILDFLADYVTAHFTCEEKLQIESSYPNYEKHKYEHDEFLKSFIDLRYMYGNFGISEEIVVKIKVSLVNWLRNHILESDKVFIMYYRKKQYN